MPRFGRGLYPMKGCVHWYINYWKERAEGRAANPVRSEGEVLKNELMRAKVAEATGHLISRKETADVWTSALMRLGKFLDTIPRALGRELNWSTDTVRIVAERIDEGRVNFVRDSAEYIDPVETEKQRAAEAKGANRGRKS